jgi:glutamine amidotransferase
MCRLVAWLGAPLALDELLYRQPHSLEHQSWHPTEQRHGTINADGWGVGWYAPAVRAEPARYRVVRPMWADANLRSMAGLVTTPCAVGAVRSATPPVAVDEVNTPPYVADRWLFAHNGAVAGWGAGVGESLRRRLSPARAAGIQGSTDSEVLFALALDALDSGCPPAVALASVVETVTAEAPARLTMVLASGETVAAAIYGDTLGWSTAVVAGGTWLGSEPFRPRDELRPGEWQDLADGTVLTCAADGLHIEAL